MTSTSGNSRSATVTIGLLVALGVAGLLMTTVLRDTAAFEPVTQLVQGRSHSDDLWRQLEHRCPRQLVDAPPDHNAAEEFAASLNVPEAKVPPSMAGLRAVSESAIEAVPEKSFMQGLMIPIPSEFRGALRHRLSAVLSDGSWEESDSYVIVALTVGDEQLLCYALRHSARAIAVGSASETEIRAETESEPEPFVEWFTPDQPSIGLPLAVEHRVGNSLAVFQPAGMEPNPGSPTFNMLAWLADEHVLVHVLGENVSDEQLLSIADALTLD